MRGLDPRIHDFITQNNVDGRGKPGQDEIKVPSHFRNAFTTDPLSANDPAT